MTLRKLLPLIILILSLNFSFSQNNRRKNISKEERMRLVDSVTKSKKNYKSKLIGYFITEDKKTKIYSPKDWKESFSSGDYSLSGQYLNYYDKNGKKKKIAQKKVSELISGNNHFTRLKIGSLFGFERLQEILIQNNNHILTQYFFEGNFYIYLFNKKTKEFIYKKKRIPGKTESDKKMFTKIVKPYFTNCDIFIKQVNLNLSKKYKLNLKRRYFDESDLFKSISNISCD